MCSNGAAERHPDRPIADTAYGSGPMLGWLVKRKIMPHIPVIDKAGRRDGTWPRTDFEWDADNNQYICPEGEALRQFRRNSSDPNPWSDGQRRHEVSGPQTHLPGVSFEDKVLPKSRCPQDHP